MPRSKQGLTLEALDKMVMKAATVTPRTARELADRAGIEDPRTLGRSLGGLVERGQLVKVKARVPLYGKPSAKKAAA